MKTGIYFIPGLGTDHRLFSKLLKDHLPLTIVPWKIPFPNENISSYAARMVAEIPSHHQEVILGGISFGGMMAIEMAKQIKAKKLILISSVKTRKELPIYIKVWKYLPVYKLMSGNFLKKAAYLGRFIFGKMNQEDSEIFKQMVEAAHPQFIRWGIHEIVNWKNEEFPSNLVHIHGTRDLIFPLWNLSEPVLPIKKGTHIMVFTSAGEVNTILKKECKLNE